MSGDAAGEGAAGGGRMRALAHRAAAAPRAATVGYFRGLTYPFRGMRFVYLTHPGLIRFWIFPIVLTLLALVGISYGVWLVHDDVVDLVVSEPTGDGVWASVGRFFHGLLEVVVLLVLLLFGLLVVVVLTNVLAAPFNDALSEEVERLVTGRAGPPFSFRALVRDVVRTVGLETVKLALYVTVMGPLWLVSLLVPVAGQVAYSVFAFFFTTSYFAMDYVDWPVSRRDRGVRYRFGLMRQHFTPMMGFGSGVWILLFVPLLNLLFMPAAVAGGTLLFLDLVGEGSASRRPE